jgi:hypothetical protein
MRNRHTSEILKIALIAEQKTDVLFFLYGFIVEHADEGLLISVKRAFFKLLLPTTLTLCECMCRDNIDPELYLYTLPAKQIAEPTTDTAVAEVTQAMQNLAVQDHDEADIAHKVQAARKVMEKAHEQKQYNFRQAKNKELAAKQARLNNALASAKAQANSQHQKVMKDLHSQFDASLRSSLKRHQNRIDQLSQQHAAVVARARDIFDQRRAASEATQAQDCEALRHQFQQTLSDLLAATEVPANMPVRA